MALSETTTVESLLTTQSGLIGPEIYETTLNTSAWLKLVKQGNWPDGMGESISILTVDRVVPASPLTWTSVTFNDQTNNCVPDAQRISFAQTLKTYNLEQGALESDRICVNDARMSFQFRRQLQLIYNKLIENTAWAWIQRHRNEYLRLAKNKVVAAAGLPGWLDDNTGIALADWASAPTSRLTQGLLRRIYLRLVQDGASRGSYGMERGRPVFAAIMSAETSDQLIRANSDIRQDFRESSRVDELLQPLGVERSYGGFYHLIDNMPPRVGWVDDGSGGTVLDLIEPYELVSTTKGNKAEVSAEYDAAPYELTFVFHPDVYQCMVVSSMTSAGGNTQFDPQSYRGDWRWLNIQSEDKNPDRSWGYFRGLFTCGSMPIRNEWGWAILHQRCEPDLDFASCEAASSSAVV